MPAATPTAIPAAIPATAYIPAFLPAALTRRMRRWPIWRQRGKIIGPKRQKAGRVDTWNAQNGDLPSTRQTPLRRSQTPQYHRRSPEAPSANLRSTAVPPEVPSANLRSTAVPPEVPSAGMAKKVIFLPLFRLKQKNFAENRLKHRFLLADGWIRERDSLCFGHERVLSYLLYLAPGGPVP